MSSDCQTQYRWLYVRKPLTPELRSQPCSLCQQTLGTDHMVTCYELWYAPLQASTHSGEASDAPCLPEARQHRHIGCLHPLPEPPALPE